MPLSIFDWLFVSLRAKKPEDDPAFRSLTHEEIRELLRMRQDVRLAREKANAYISWNRSFPL
jgi:hypothetical protein